MHSGKDEKTAQLSIIAELKTNSIEIFTNPDIGSGGSAGMVAGSVGMARNRTHRDI